MSATVACTGSLMSHNAPPGREGAGPLTAPDFPLVTIGITCFNAAETISRAIASAVSQEWPSLEILVVDDCSTDESGSVIHRALAGVAGARVLRHRKNSGVAVARNTLLEMASGEFIAFFDDDDESVPTRVSIQYEAIRQHECKTGASVIACYGSGAREYPNGYRVQAQAIGSRERGPVGTEVVDYLLFNERKSGVSYGAGIPTCALMARTATLREVGGFDPSLRRVEDVDLAIRLGLAGAHFIGCAEELYLQRATLGADKTPVENLASELLVVEKYRDYLKQRGLYEYARDWFVFRERYFSKHYLSALLCLLNIAANRPFRAARHLLRSAPARLRHERAMNAPVRPQS
ncbi:glycosyltransferase [Phenylobacterium sp.]|uniref:glycosyltransferase n=1 Tax=Phenylobacterium sp. TaxID=1871053 RepID=UPI002F95BA0E